jgi:hypothetical protein
MMVAGDGCGLAYVAAAERGKVAVQLDESTTLIHASIVPTISRYTHYCMESVHRPQYAFSVPTGMVLSEPVSSACRSPSLARDLRRPIIVIMSPRPHFEMKSEME